MRNFFKELNELNVNEHIETKNNLSFLSWMWAWTELKKRFPLSYSTVYEAPDGSLLWKDPIGAHVKTGVTIVWDDEEGHHEHEALEYLPVFDFRNKVIPYENIDALSVNKTIQRSLTKCIARLGLGAYIYAGEDLPEESEDVKAQRAAEAEKIRSTIADMDALIKKVTASMTGEEKKKFGDDYIVPLIGGYNYKAVKDYSKLETLYESLKNKFN